LVLQFPPPIKMTATI